MAVISKTASPGSDYFFHAYNRPDVAYGQVPSAPLAEYLAQIQPLQSDRKSPPAALDLGAGAGRDTLALAAAGYQTTAVDLSDRGLRRIADRAAQAGIERRVTMVAADVVDFEIMPNHFDAIVATTVLDHVPADQAVRLWQRIVRGLRDGGVLYAEVHTTEDPGSDTAPGNRSIEPVSETAGAVVNYFAPNQLATWASAREANLRILHYQERLEWDTTHGDAHLHGKAVLLAVTAGYHPPWFGQPPAFPKPTVG